MDLPPNFVKLDRHRGDRHRSGGYEDSYHNHHRGHPRGPPRYSVSPSMTRFEEDDEAFSRRRRRGNSPSSYRVGGGDGGGRRWEGDSPTDRDFPGEGIGEGGFRPMNGPPGRVDFQPMGPRDGGSFRPMGFAFDGGFRPMGLNGGVGVEGTRPIVGAGGGREGFRPSGPVKFPPSENLDGGRFIGDSDYSVRPPPPPPVQQRLSGQKRGHPLSENDSFTGTGKRGFTLPAMSLYSCNLRVPRISCFCANQRLE